MNEFGFARRNKPIQSQTFGAEVEAGQGPPADGHIGRPYGLRLPSGWRDSPAGRAGFAGTLREREGGINAAVRTLCNVGFLSGFRSMLPDGARRPDSAPPFSPSIRAVAAGCDATGPATAGP